MEGASEDMEGPDRVDRDRDGEGEGAVGTVTGKKTVGVRAFIAALRSGLFAQAAGALQLVEHENYEAGFCCLGVACEVAIANGLQLSTQALPDPSEKVPTRKLFMHYDEEMSLLPEAVQLWYGFADDNPDLKVPAEVGNEAGNEAFQEQWQEDPDARFAAAELNDEYGFTFAQIADCFEYTFLPQDWEVTRATRG